MPEACGTLLIKAPADVLAEMQLIEDVVNWAAMAKLFSSAGIESPVKSNPMLEYQEGEDFPIEAIENRGGFICIEIFGDEWMDAMQPLIRKGDNIEVYGSIFHEHGFKEYYALSDAGERFLETVEYEGDHDVDEDAIIEDWLTVIPPEVKAAFPEIFEQVATEDADEEDDDLLDVEADL